MRELTEEELKLAPDWATHYINKCFIVVFLSKHLRQIFIKEGSYFNQSTLNEGGLGGALEIPIKPFDITKHEWGDGGVGNAESSGDDLIIEDSDYDISSILINKCDAIAIAKHFGLTAEDLK